MEHGLSGGRVFSREGHDLLIEAQAPLSGHAGFRRIAFHASYIDYIFEVDAKASGMALRNGVVIPVALSFSDLKAQVYGQDFRAGSSIDLTFVTGQAAQGVAHIELSTEFNPVSGPSEQGTEKPMTIRAVLRKPSSNQYIIHTFSEGDIARLEAEEETRAREGQSVQLHFRAVAKTVPLLQECHYLLLDMRHTDFLGALMKAKARGDDFLDLARLFADNPKKFGFTP